MIQTWIANVTSLLEIEIYQKHYDSVPAWRKEKADKLRHPINRAQSIGAWVLYEKMKKEYDLKEDAHFNLSHSGDYVMCSVDDSGDEAVEVGCDLEQIKEPRLKLAKRYFCESEYELVEKNEDYFYRFWVFKESYVKATGEGLKQGLNTFEIKFDEENCPVLAQGHYYLKEYNREGLSYRMAVCSNKKEFAQEVREVNL